MKRVRGSQYKPISAYGVIGDMRTAALVGQDGSVDWCCFPRFDSPSVFAAILDEEHGGCFRIAPVQPFTSTQRYFPLTNILVTTFHLHDGSGAIEVLDFMPAPGVVPVADPHELHRRVRGVLGLVEVGVLYQPRLDYARGRTRLRRVADGVVADCGADVLSLKTRPGMEWELDAEAAAASARFMVTRTQDVWLTLQWNAEDASELDGEEAQQKLNLTATYWHEWAGRLSFEGTYRPEVERSALALKLLFYEPTGAVVAAATTSLPEEIGGGRNWDYRYCWLRDAVFTLSALNIVGLYEEAARFMHYLQWVAEKSTDSLQIMYGVGGETELTEYELNHLTGYRNSAPVRIGNGAHSQLQLDIYGELLGAVFLWHQRHMVDAGFWQLLVRVVNWVAANWRRPDSGIWEIRGEPRHYVYSKVMCWVALDRAIKMAEELGAPPSLATWQRERDAIQAEVMTRGYSTAKQAFVQSYDSDALDAVNLLLPVYGFIAGDDPRFQATIRATLRELTHNGMLYRYTNDDGLAGQEGVFSICTFWLADALILSGDVEGGERVFRRMLRFANSLGLYSEQLDPRTGDFLGNFPQAFTHIALINTAYLIEKAYG